MIYFTMKKLNENRAFLGMLCFLLVFSCSKDKKEGNGNGNGDATKVTLTITKPTGGKLVSNAGGINCGSKGDACKASFNKDTKVTLTAQADTGHVPADWQGDCDKTKADQPCQLSMDADKTVGLTFTNDIDGDSVLNVDDVDDDNDGLIEIHNLDMFDHIRHNPDGTSYRSGSTATANTQGAPEEATDDCKTVTAGVYLCGYELARDLDFSDEKSYAVGSTKKNNWQPNKADPDSATNEGFVGIDDFAGTFEGNGYSISQLYRRNISDQPDSDNDTYMGLFATTTATAAIRSLGVVNAHLYGDRGFDYVGALVSWNSGSISASYATGAVNGGGGSDAVGGLVGYNEGSIVASYATGAANGDAGGDAVGGLVGNNYGSIVASYATGDANGGVGSDSVGGLVGRNADSIGASYATGAANGDAGDDAVGGLVGKVDAIGTTSVTASYATGAANGGAGDDAVGGLVGSVNTGTNTITASYATGAANGDVGSSDHVGALVGEVTADSAGTTTNTITHSYAFGATADVDTAGNDGDAHPAGLSGSGAAKANTLTDPSGSENTDAAAEWDDTGEKTKGAWDFGTNSQAPALRYADYDGPGASSVDYCAMFPAKIPETGIDLECGKSLLPNQPGR